MMLPAVTFSPPNLYLIHICDSLDEYDLRNVILAEKSMPEILEDIADPTQSPETAAMVVVPDAALGRIAESRAAAYVLSLIHIYLDGSDERTGNKACHRYGQRSPIGPGHHHADADGESDEHDNRGDRAVSYTHLDSEAVASAIAVPAEPLSDPPNDPTNLNGAAMPETAFWTEWSGPLPFSRA